MACLSAEVTLSLVRHTQTSKANYSVQNKQTITIFTRENIREANASFKGHVVNK